MVRRVEEEREGKSKEEEKKKEFNAEFAESAEDAEKGRCAVNLW